MIVVQIIKQTVDLKVFRIHVVTKDPKGMIAKIRHDTRWSNTMQELFCPPLSDIPWFSFRGHHFRINKAIFAGNSLFCEFCIKQLLSSMAKAKVQVLISILASTGENNEPV